MGQKAVKVSLDWVLIEPVQRERLQPSLNTQSCINTSYLIESYIVFTLKMESVSKYTIFGLKMMVKSGLEKFILKSHHAGRFLLLNF